MCSAKIEKRFWELPDASLDCSRQESLNVVTLQDKEYKNARDNGNEHSDLEHAPIQRSKLLRDQILQKHRKGVLRVA